MENKNSFSEVDFNKLEKKLLESQMEILGDKCMIYDCLQNDLDVFITNKAS